MNPFSLLAGLGASLGLLRLATHSLPAGLALLAGALLGSRLEYVLVNLASYSAKPLQAFAFWEGGLGWGGALAGAVLALCAYALTRRQPLSRLADSLLSIFLPLSVALWLACWQAGAGYGIPVKSAIWSIPAPDELGEIARRWPVQPAGALLSLVGLAFLETWTRRLRHPGLPASLALLALAAPVVVLSPWMASAAPLVLGLRLYTAEAVFFIILSLLLSLAAAFSNPVSHRPIPER